MRWTEAVYTERNSRDVLRPLYPAQTLVSRLSARSTWALSRVDISNSFFMEHQLYKFIESLKVEEYTNRRVLPFLGIDECLNRSEIDLLSTKLVAQELVFCSSPLWYELRERDGEITGSFLGGVSKNSMSRRDNSLLDDIGVPRKHHSFSDHLVVQFAIANFISHDQIILLSENIRLNENGLRWILQQIVSPALKARNDDLSLIAMFKKGKTSIEDYVDAVHLQLENKQFSSGYDERLI